MAAKLAGWSPRELIEGGSSNALHRGLERMATDCVRFASEDLLGGVDGFFFAIQWATTGTLNASQQEEFGVRYDLQVLNELRGRSNILMLHLHGPMPNFALASRYPVDWLPFRYLYCWHWGRTLSLSPPRF
jgi:hypothetical protein